MSEFGLPGPRVAPEPTVGAAYRFRGDAGIRLTGEFDLSNRAVLQGAIDLLAEVGEDVYLDLSELTFIDVGGLRLLADFAAGHAPHRVVLEEPSDLVRRIFTTVWSGSGLELA